MGLPLLALASRVGNYPLVMARRLCLAITHTNAFEDGLCRYYIISKSSYRINRDGPQTR